MGNSNSTEINYTKLTDSDEFKINPAKFLENKNISFNEIILNNPELINDDNINFLYTRYKMECMYYDYRCIPNSLEETLHDILSARNQTLLNNILNNSNLSKQFILMNCHHDFHIIKACKKLNNDDIKQFILDNCHRYDFNYVWYCNCDYDPEFTYEEIKDIAIRTKHIPYYLSDLVGKNTKLITNELANIFIKREDVERIGISRDNHNIFEETSLTVDYVIENLKSFRRTLFIIKCILKARPDINSLTLNRDILEILTIKEKLE